MAFPMSLRSPGRRKRALFDADARPRVRAGADSSRHGGNRACPCTSEPAAASAQRADALTLVMGSPPAAHHGSDGSHVTVQAGHTAARRPLRLPGLGRFERRRSGPYFWRRRWSSARRRAMVSSSRESPPRRPRTGPGPGRSPARRRTPRPTRRPRPARAATRAVLTTRSGTRPRRRPRHLPEPARRARPIPRRTPVRHGPDSCGLGGKSTRSSWQRRVISVKDPLLPGALPIRAA